MIDEAGNRKRNLPSTYASFLFLNTFAPRVYIPSVLHESDNRRLAWSILHRFYRHSWVSSPCSVSHADFCLCLPPPNTFVTVFWTPELHATRTRNREKELDRSFLTHFCFLPCVFYIIVHYFTLSSSSDNKQHKIKLKCRGTNKSCRLFLVALGLLGESSCK